MLPDFEVMVRVPLVAVSDAHIQRGIDLHHRTDDAFHRAPAFLSWTSRAFEGLCETGVRRGTARAVAHIATEMFLDGCLASSPPLVRGYLAALDVDANGQLEWEDGGNAYERLRGRLSTWGAPQDYADPGFVMARLHDALRTRPALAISEAEVERVAASLPPLKHRVEQDARELLDDLRNALGLRH